MLELFKHNIGYFLIRKTVFAKTAFFILLFSSLLYPQQSRLSKEVNLISAYMSSEQFAGLNKSNNHLFTMDSLYVNALKICCNDKEDALLALTFACVPYRKVPIVIPYLKFKFDYPLVSADLNTFNQKNANLPKELFFDTPVSLYGDSDKPAHFFGSAFVSYSSNIFDLGDVIGYFVEVFEETFKVQSQADLRDLQTNHLGNLFGKLIKKNNKIMPSHIMLTKTLSLIRINL